MIGAGPAGTRAVEVLVRAGHRPVWIDEGEANGGRIHQRPLAGGVRDHATLYGTEAAKAEAIHAAGERLRAMTDWRPRTLAWNIRAGVLDTITNGRGEAIGFDRAILCTGAMDRIVPLQGWRCPACSPLAGHRLR